MPVFAETGQPFYNNFNAKMQRRGGAEEQIKTLRLCLFAPLR
jgi:hypothetical protein